MRTLLFLTALLAAAPAMADDGGHRGHSSERSHTTAQRPGSRGAPSHTDRGRATPPPRSTAPRSSAPRSAPPRGGPPPRSTARPGPRTDYGHHSHYQAPQRRVVHHAPPAHSNSRHYRHPWARGYRAAPRRGYVCVDGYYGQYGWSPGYYRPTYSRAGYVWVNGYWNGYDYVEGYWRPAYRSGYVWVDGYYNGRVFVQGGWRVSSRGRRVIYR